MDNDLVNHFGGLDATDGQQNDKITHRIQKTENGQPQIDQHHRFLKVFSIGCLIISHDIKRDYKELIKQHIEKCKNILDDDLKKSLTGLVIDEFLNENLMKMKNIVNEFKTKIIAKSQLHLVTSEQNKIK